MPNFVRFENPAGKRQDGFKNDEGFDIAHFSHKEAEEFAELMKQTFMGHWAKRKAANDGVDNTNPFGGTERAGVEFNV